MALRTIELFAGAGGGCLATQHLLGFQTACYVEREPYAVEVLKARIADGMLHDAPIWDDVRTFPAHEFRGQVDVVCGGFPCQPFSVAGKGLAQYDDRNGWPATADIIRSLRPRFAYLENVPGLLSGSHGYYGEILGELAEAGFDVEWGVLSAQDVGAPHIRKRLWILATNRADPERGRLEALRSSLADADEERPQGAEPQPQPEYQSGQRSEPGYSCGTELANADSGRQQSERERGLLDGQRQALRHDADGCGGSQLADANSAGREEQRGAESVGPEHAPVERRSCRGEWWHEDPADRPAESGVGRVANGVAHRVDRLRCTGNGQVPLVAATAWHLLRGE